MGFNPSDLTAGHIAPQGGGHEPLRQRNFWVEIYGIGAGEDLISLSIESAFLPNMTLNEIELQHGNESVYVAGHPTWDTGQLTIKDWVDESVAMAIREWSLKHYDPETGKIGRAANYKKMGRTLQFGPDGSKVRYWRNQGIWITTYNPGTIDYNADDEVKIELTLRIDKAFGPFWQ